jgi:outer membrane protein assembly factor BamB
VYDARTGFPLWGDLFDRDPAPGGFDQANRVEIQDRRFFVTGLTAAPGGNCTNPFTSGGNCDFTLRACDIRTGGILWQKMFDLAGGFDAAGPIAVKDGKVVAARRGQVNNVFPTDTLAGPLIDWLVRTYDARTGALLWQDRFDHANGHDRVVGVAIQGRRVVAVGRSASKPSGLRQDEDWLVRTYER